MVNYSTFFWEHLQYKQKRSLYQLVNDVAINPSERFLNLWWFSLSLYKRESIISDLASISVKELLEDDK